jgi:hypothetical protein
MLIRLEDAQVFWMSIFGRVEHLRNFRAVSSADQYPKPHYSPFACFREGVGVKLRPKMHISLEGAHV